MVKQSNYVLTKWKEVCKERHFFENESNAHVARFFVKIQLLLNDLATRNADHGKHKLYIQWQR